MCKVDRREYMLDRDLEQELKKPPRETLEQARGFVYFACCCVRGTPAGEGKVVLDLLNDPRLRLALEAAETWARKGTCPRLAAILDEALAAADEPMGAVERVAAEAAATTVWAANDADHAPALGVNLAVIAAAKARRAGIALFRESVCFQWELARQLWPSRIRAVPVLVSLDHGIIEAASPLAGRCEAAFGEETVLSFATSK